MRSVFIILLLLCVLGSLYSTTSAGDAQRQTVWTKAYDNFRTGAYTKEATLTPTNVNVNTFGLIFQRDIVGHVYAQPLYVPNIGGKNLVIVATMANFVYAFDADDPDAAAPIWAVQLGPSASLKDNVLGIGDGSIFCKETTGFLNIAIEVGILSTPVLDTTSNTLYVMVMNKDAPNVYNYRLHALDITSGAERQGSPVVVNADYPRPSDGSRIVFKAVDHAQRPALTLANGIVYAAFGSFCDRLPYWGFVLGYDAKSLQLQKKWNSDPQNGGNAIWMSGDGLAVDEAGKLYLQTSNGEGPFDPNTGTYTNALIKLDPEAANGEGIMPVSTYFRPVLADEHLDVGCTGVTLVPNTKLAISGSKDGWIALTNRDNMGGWGMDKPLQVTDMSPANRHPDPKYGNIHQSPVYYEPAHAFYTWPEEESLHHLELTVSSATTGTFKVVRESTWRLPLKEMPGGMLTVSANGADFNTAIVWGSRPVGDAKDAVRDGILHAFKASDVTQELWNSNQNAARDAVGAFPKFVSPLVMDGRVYLPTQSYGDDNRTKLKVYANLVTRIVDGPNLGFVSRAYKPGEQVTLQVRATGKPGLQYSWFRQCQGQDAAETLADAKGKSFVYSVPAEYVTCQLWAEVKGSDGVTVTSDKVTVTQQAKDPITSDPNHSNDAYSVDHHFSSIMVTAALLAGSALFLRAMFLV